MRAPLDAQIARASVVVIIGDEERVAKLIEACTAQAKPVLKARMVPRQDRRWLSVLPVIGFAGIARPSKFFATLRNEGARLIDTRAYPDHYRYSERQARSLLKEAKDYNAMLVTTEKDYVRLEGEPDSAVAELKHRSRPFPVRVEFADIEAVKALLAAVIAVRHAVQLAEALERSGRVDIGLLQLDAPIAQLLERNGAAGDGAAHEIAGRHHLHLAVEIFELRFALEGDVAFEAIHQCIKTEWLFRIASP